MSSSDRILIVDDDAALAETLSFALDAQYEVLTARTGLAAIELIAREHPDLVLLDHILPGMSGLVLLRSIKKLFPSVLVIVITAFGTEEVCTESFRGGARDYLKKPFKADDLLARIGHLLATRHHGGKPRAHLLLDPTPPPPDDGNGSKIASAQRAIAFIQGHLDEHLTLAQVSREAGMSKFHFCRSFKGFTGITFREYLARHRITRAVGLLRDRNRSVTDVCLEVGFEDLSHFGRVFRKITGQLPSTFRRSALDRDDGMGRPVNANSHRPGHPTG